MGLFMVKKGGEVLTPIDHRATRMPFGETLSRIFETAGLGGLVRLAYDEPLETALLGGL